MKAQKNKNEMRQVTDMISSVFIIHGSVSKLDLKQQLVEPKPAILYALSPLGLKMKAGLC